MSSQQKAHVTLTVAAQTPEASVGGLEHRASEVEAAPGGALARSSVSHVGLQINRLERIVALHVFCF